MLITRRAAIALGLAPALAMTMRPLSAYPRVLLTGGVSVHVVERGESLALIGARAGLEPVTLAADNALRADVVLQPGQLLRIDNRHLVPSAAAALVLNVPQRMLFHHRPDGTVTGYPIAVGRSGWETPRGRFEIVNKRTNPVWTVPPSILEEARRAGRILPSVVPPGPDNPLGRHWIGVSLPGIGLHGTNAPASIFRTASHGCVRLHPADVAELFNAVDIGTAGLSVYEPVMIGRSDGRVLLEVHRDAYRVFGGRLAPLVDRLAAAAGLEDDIDWAAAADIVVKRPGVARDVTRT